MEGAELFASQMIKFLQYTTAYRIFLYLILFFFISHDLLAISLYILIYLSGTAAFSGVLCDYWKLTSYNTE